MPSGVSLLQYADDTTFFIHGSWAAAHTLSTMMDIFSDFSGLQLNRAKSSFIRFRLSPEKLAGCSRILATPVDTLPIRYLGVPLVDRRQHMQDWHPVIEKVESRLTGWRARLLSRGGRLVLLKAVLIVILIYFMAIFRMPVGVRRRLEQMMRVFSGWAPDLRSPRGRLWLHGRQCAILLTKEGWASGSCCTLTQPFYSNGFVDFSNPQGIWLPRC